MAEEYSDGAGGLSGNDDAGQMSAWYVFAAMGFYPVDPVSDEYILCTPLFDSITMQLQHNKKLELVSNKKTTNAAYIYKILWNGKVYRENYITYSMISNGASWKYFCRISLLHGVLQ